MQTLTRALLEARRDLPVGVVPQKRRVLQFGEGGFLRAFVDQMFDVANEALGLDLGVVVVQPIRGGLVEKLAEQDNLYTVMLRGKQGGQAEQTTRIIRTIVDGINPYAQFDAFLKEAANPDLRFIVSNTTEAGIAYTGKDRFEDRPQASFPGKLTRFLYERFQRFAGAMDKGLILLPCELIDGNADALRDCVEKTARQWSLGEDFLVWIREANIFCNTLVDRIVTGFPREESEALYEALGYRDALLDVAEPFGLWVIEGPEAVRGELPLEQAGLPVVFTDDVKPYKLRKVRMLNGGHTSMVLGAYLAGKNTVAECMADPLIRGLLEHALSEEILPTLDLPREELEAFGAAVLERFENPYNKHYLLSIALNSVSKFRARVLPTIQAYVQRFGALPPRLTFSLAALIAFYRGNLSEQGTLVGERNGEAYPIVDDPEVIAFFLEHSALPAQPLARAVLGNQDFWGADLNAIPDFTRAVSDQLHRIQTLGALRAMEDLP